MEKSNPKQIWKKLPEPEEDPIFQAIIKYFQDRRPYKVNLTAGIYKTEELKPYIIEPIKEFVNEFVANDDDSLFDELAQGDYEKTPDLLINEIFGLSNPYYQMALTENRVIKIPVQSGGNGLYFGFEYYKHLNPFSHKSFAGERSTVYYSDPTWPIHCQMIEFHNLNAKPYRYYDQINNRLNFETMMEDLNHMKIGDLLLLQPCGHNPTGFDPNESQWMELADLCRNKGVIVFMDFAYMGFASGNIIKDSFPLNLFLEKRIEMLITFSCAKNFGLYSCRVGFFLSIMNSSERIEEMKVFLSRKSRLLFGKPTSVGQVIVRRILECPQKKQHWYKAFKIMHDRIHQSRIALRDNLHRLGSHINWDFLVDQSGMFAYTGLTEEETQRVQSEYGVFLLTSGRISMAGINMENVQRVAIAFYNVTNARLKTKSTQ